jgi:hypothetical protein
MLALSPKILHPDWYGKVITQGVEYILARHSLEGSPGHIEVPVAVEPV